MSAREIGDHVAISQLLQRYFAALDDKDWSLLDTVFTPDASLRYDMEEGQETDYATMKPRFQRFLERFYLTQHMPGPPLIELRGDIARSSNAVRAIHVQVTSAGDRKPWTVYGRYRDEHTRTADGWRIWRRHFQAAHVDGELLPASRVKRFPEAPWLLEPWEDA